MKIKEKLTAYQYLLKDKLSGDKNRELIALLKDIKLAARQVAKELNSATLNNTIGDLSGKKNTHGEEVKKLDIVANNLFIKSLENGGNCAGIVSEEKDKVLIFNNEVSRSSKYLVCIDPLDGTKQFITKTDEFTTNIALIFKGQPVLGVVCAPALNKTWISNDQSRHSLETTSIYDKPIRLVSSTSHQSDLDRAFLAFLDEQSIMYDASNFGSSLKICMLVDGEADLYCRFGPTSEWDTAAAHAVLLGAGGHLLDLKSFQSLQYGKQESVLNPHFLAINNTLDLNEVCELLENFNKSLV